MKNTQLNILQISPMVPFPLDNGGTIGIYGFTKYLSDRNHKIDFVTYRKQIDYNYAFRQLSEISNPYILDVQTENSIPGALLNLFSPVPYNISKYNRRKLRVFLRSYLKKHKPDIIHVDNLHMAWTLDIIREMTEAPVVLRQNNVELLIMKRFFEAEDNFLIKKYSEIQYKKFLKYEPETCVKFDKCLMITEEDRNLILKLNPAVKTEVIPAGVSSDLLKREKVPLIPKSLFHIGSLKWLPNIDGLTWFLKEIFPLVVEKIPDVILYIYSTGSETLKIDNKIKDNVIIKGRVENLFDDIADKDLAVVPLRIGGGMRVKLIELMAMGKNIVSSPVGKEGIPVSDGEHIYIADSVDSFVQKITGHFSEESRINTEKARQFVADHYTWERVAEKTEAVYQGLL